MELEKLACQDGLEIWKSIACVEGFYQASNLGRIRRAERARGTRPFKVLKLRPVGRDWNRKNSYLVFMPSVRGEVSHKLFYVHRVVYEAFFGEIPAGLQVNHKDGNKRNNRIDNLELLTPKQNMRHAGTNGLLRIGERNRSTKLNADKVRLIRKLVGEKVSQTKIAKTFGVARSQIWLIMTGKTWKHVT